MPLGVFHAHQHHVGEPRRLCLPLQASKHKAWAKYFSGRQQRYCATILSLIKSRPLGMSLSRLALRRVYFPTASAQSENSFEESEPRYLQNGISTSGMSTSWTTPFPCSDGSKNVSSYQVA